MSTCADIERGWNQVAEKLQNQFGTAMAEKIERAVLRMLASEQHWMDRMDMTPTECRAIHEALATCNELLAQINARDVKPAFSHA